MLAPVLHPASGQWVLGKIENHTARPLTHAEIESVVASAEHARTLEGDRVKLWHACDGFEKSVKMMTAPDAEKAIVLDAIRLLREKFATPLLGPKPL